ncbi:hypothetical protein DMA11_17200 [Marinilabiliaceae bacterium JC017]|nr:hypothetical protein DMA11_17200 [Marinilabiliaceae bacterium JC017]
MKISKDLVLIKNISLYITLAFIVISVSMDDSPLVDFFKTYKIGVYILCQFLIIQIFYFYKKKKL